MALTYITKTEAGNKALGNYSFAVIPEKGAMPVHLAGTIGVGSDGKLVEGGVKEQTHQALKNIEAVLGEVNCDRSRIVMLSVRLADLALFSEFDAALGEHFGDGPYPARETVGTDVPLGALVEITTQAYLPVES